MNLVSTWNRFGAFAVLAAFAVGLSVALVGCDGDTQIETVFVEVPLFEEPPTEAQGFLGYDDQETKLTVCGNCHVGQQTKWQETAHASAWEGLQASGHASESCENCHTVGPLGNPTADGGWATTANERYHDVQCESCHGPGQLHVSNPDVEANHPLGSITQGDITADDLTGAMTCAQCHQDTHHPFVEDWIASPHAEPIASAAGREPCNGCHGAQAAIARFGDNSNYLEKDEILTAPLGQVCVVCHDPHGSPYEAQLRFPVATTSIENHLCAQCHDRRTVPDPNSSHGLEPHSPEATLLVGDAGWFPPNSQIDQGAIRATHGSDRNPTLCASCHVPTLTVTDATTGDFVVNATGHLFRPIPCLDDQGIPRGFEDDCELSPQARSYAGCTSSGCHGDEQAAFSALTAAVARIQDRADELHELLEEVDPNGEEPGGEIDGANPTFTVAEGSLFNHSLAEFGGEHYGTNTVVGSAVHNPFLIEALLIGSIQAMEAEYGLQANTRVNYDEEIEKLVQRMPQDVRPLRRRDGFTASPMPTRRGAPRP